MRQLLVSRIKTPDGTILTSRHTHDYVTHFDSVSNEEYILDGGTDYIRQSLNNIEAENISIYTDSPFEDIRENLCRGTFDDNGNRIWIPLKEMTKQHLFNCIIYCAVKLDDNQEIDKFKAQYIRELAYRINNE